MGHKATHLLLDLTGAAVPFISDLFFERSEDAVAAITTFYDYLKDVLVSQYEHARWIATEAVFDNGPAHFARRSCISNHFPYLYSISSQGI
jgi:hypothetical protein